jgi:hypothetical protein
MCATVLPWPAARFFPELRSGSVLLAFLLRMVSIFLLGKNRFYTIDNLDNGSFAIKQSFIYYIPNTNKLYCLFAIVVSPLLVCLPFPVIFFKNSSLAIGLEHGNETET